MKIAVFGAGALGGYFGGRLLQAGNEVSFIARGAHLEALQSNGLTVESALGNAHLTRIHATSDPSDIGAVDLVIFLVKLYDTDAASHALAPLLGDDTAVVSFQNGVDAWDRIGRVVGPQRVLGGIAYIFADVRAPGVIRHSGSLARLVFGEFNGSSSGRTTALEAALQSAGVDAQQVDNIDVRIWEKFVVLSALSGVTTLTRLPIGDVLADEHCASLFQEALDETARVGRGQCKSLSGDIAERQMSFAQSLPPGMRASMLDDLERGKRLELNDLSGAVVRLGRSLGIETPVHSTIQRALHPYAQGRN
ncbi:MAG: ketopantoate reductase family protein [Gammaproteobacteria bacterium]